MNSGAWINCFFIQNIQAMGLLLLVWIHRKQTMNSLQMPKGLAEAIIRIRASNAMENWSKRKQMVYKILHGKLKIEQHEPRKIRYALSAYPVYCFIQYTFIEYNIVRYSDLMHYCMYPHNFSYTLSLCSCSFCFYFTPFAKWLDLFVTMLKFYSPTLSSPLRTTSSRSYASTSP